MASEATTAATKTKTERTRGSERAIQAFPAVGRPLQLRDNLEEVSPSPFGLPSKPRARPFSPSHSTCAPLRAREMQGSPYSSKPTSARACSIGATKGAANHFENGRQNRLADRRGEQCKHAFRKLSSHRDCEMVSALLCFQALYRKLRLNQTTSRIRRSIGSITRYASARYSVLEYAMPTPVCLRAPV